MHTVTRTGYRIVTVLVCIYFSCSPLPSLQFPPLGVVILECLIMDYELEMTSVSGQLSSTGALMITI